MQQIKKLFRRPDCDCVSCTYRQPSGNRALKQESPDTTSEDTLRNIEKENVESTNLNRFHGFYSPDWSDDHE